MHSALFKGALMNKNIPNIITVFRFVLVIVFAVFFFSPLENGRMIAAGIFLLAEFSDALDGYLARKYQIVSDFGKIMDPLADKVMQIVVAVCVAVAEPSLIWVPIFLFAKEIVMVIGAANLLTKDTVVKANWAGKLASVIYFVVFTVIMLFKDISPSVKQLLCGTFVAFSILAFIIYGIDFIQMVKKKK